MFAAIILGALFIFGVFIFIAVRADAKDRSSEAANNTDKQP
jgi:hypothetical protein